MAYASVIATIKLATIAMISPVPNAVSELLDSSAEASVDTVDASVVTVLVMEDEFRVSAIAVTVEELLGPAVVVVVVVVIINVTVVDSDAVVELPAAVAVAVDVVVVVAVTVYFVVDATSTFTTRGGR